VRLGLSVLVSSTVVIGYGNYLAQGKTSASDVDKPVLKASAHRTTREKSF